MKLFDKLFFNGVAIAFLSLLFFLITKNYVAGMFIGYLFWIVCRTIFLYIINRYHVTKNITVSEMENIFAVWGTQLQQEHFFNLLPSCFSPVIENCFIRYTKNGEDNIMILNYKFSPTSCEDVAKVYREWKNFPGKISILGKTPSKDVLLLAGSLPIRIEFPSSKSVRKFLIKSNALPSKIPSKKSTKASLSIAFNSTFSPEKAKYYFFSAIFFSFYAILNIHRIWYISFSVLLSLLGIGCVLVYFLRRNKKEE